MDIYKMVANDLGVQIPMDFAAKRSHDGTPKAEKAGRPLKVAAAKIEAEDAVKKDVHERVAMTILEKARQLMTGPDTTVEMCSGLSPDGVKAIRAWMDDEPERNGPLFYAKLAQFFVDGYREFKVTYDQWTLAKGAVDKAWIYRMHVLFMTPEGTMSREGIKSALDFREDELKKAAQLAAQHQVRQTDIQNAMNNPQMIAAMLQNPQVQAMFAQMMANNAGNGGDTGMD
jgi:hypothetical protein